MGSKSVQKKKFILETARKVFVEKGFKRVTMKDIVEACEISRGGLYLYFGSTSEIFLEVLKMESEETDDVFSDNITEDTTAAEILAIFLKEGGEGAQLQNFPFRGNAPPQKYWKVSAKDLLNISTAAEPKLSVFQLLLEEESLSLKKTNKISKNL